MFLFKVVLIIFVLMCNFHCRSFPESQFQLDTDYIQRYLGELSLMQESRLVQLRKWVADLQKGKVVYLIIIHALKLKFCNVA